jgi:hypothetical protein
MAKSSRILKVAGLSFVGFCAVSLAADKVALSPETAQWAGFCGAFLGALAGRGRPGRLSKQENTPAEEALVAEGSPESKAEEVTSEQDG